MPLLEVGDNELFYVEQGEGFPVVLIGHGCGGRPELVDRSPETGLACEAVAPHLGVHAVVRLLAVDLGGEPGDRRVGRGLQPLEPQLVHSLVEHAPSDRHRLTTGPAWRS